MSIMNSTSSLRNPATVSDKAGRCTTAAIASALQLPDTVVDIGQRIAIVVSLGQKSPGTVIGKVNAAAIFV